MVVFFFLSTIQQIFEWLQRHYKIRGKPKRRGGRRSIISGTKATCNIHTHNHLKPLILSYILEHLVTFTKWIKHVYEFWSTHIGIALSPLTLYSLFPYILKLTSSSHKFIVVISNLLVRIFWHFTQVYISSLYIATHLIQCCLLHLLTCI